MQHFKAGVWRWLHALSPALEWQLRRRFSRSCDQNWGYRTRLVRRCPDNAFIPRVPEAGRIVAGYQIMHNGLKVVPGSYYGEGPVKLLRKNRGVHEPQEERAFQEVLKTIPAGGVILELGAYWAFYSLWFCKTVPEARAYLVEPLAENLAYGQQNFAANGLQGHFTRAYAGAAPGVAPDGVPVIAVDEFVARHQLRQVAILHSDIQGAELDMLRGSQQSLEQGRILWFFISTHNDDLHAACEQFLRERGVIIVASIPNSESYSTDGVLVARHATAPAIPPLTLSRRGVR